MDEILIIGYGNVHREDDGVAWHILNKIALQLELPEPSQEIEDLDHYQGWPHLLCTLQLVPELAEVIAKYDQVCFVDAHTGAYPEDVRFEKIEDLIGILEWKFLCGRADRDLRCDPEQILSVLSGGVSYAAECPLMIKVFDIIHFRYRRHVNPCKCLRSSFIQHPHPIQHRRSCWCEVHDAVQFFRRFIAGGSTPHSTELFS